MEKDILIDGVNVAGCNYAILPKNQCPAKPQPYAKETSCIACKEHNTKLNFCKNNPNCYYKQLQREIQKNDVLSITREKLIADLAIAEDSLRNVLAANEKLKEYIKNVLSPHAQMLHDLSERYKQALEEIKELLNHCDNQDICTLCQYADECRDEHDYALYNEHKLIVEVINEVLKDE